MNHDPLETLSAFLDGEQVDPRELAAALASDDAREHLRDFALLRADVHEDDARPGRAFYDEMDRRLGQTHERRFARIWRIEIPLPALAGVAAIALGALLWISLGPVRAPAAEAPAPDRTISFERGVDWHPISNHAEIARDRTPNEPRRNRS